MCIAIVRKPGCDVMNFEVNLIFVIKPFSLHDQKAKERERERENKLPKWLRNVCKIKKCVFNNFGK